MKKISSRFSIATHILVMMALSPPLTGDQMAASVQTNPVVIRRIIGQLKRAGLVNVKAGIGEQLCARILLKLHFSMCTVP